MRYLIFLFLLITSACFANVNGGVNNPNQYLEEVDGSPSSVYWKTVVPTGSMTENADGSVSLNLVTSDHLTNEVLLLDQTTPQTVSSGAPNFSAGLGVGISPALYPVHIYLRQNPTGGDFGFYEDYQGEIQTNAVGIAFGSYYKNTGSEAAGTGHGIGVWGSAEDTATGHHFLIGTEGKVTAYGDAPDYHGVAGYTRWYNAGAASPTSILKGVSSKVEIKTAEGGAEIAGGNAVCFWADPILGGAAATKYSLYGTNRIYTISTETPSSVLDYRIGSNWQADSQNNTVRAGVYSYVKNTGSNAAGTGHDIGVLGLVEDVAGGTFPLYGVEGRINSTSTNLFPLLYGVLGLSTWSDPNSNNSGTFSGWVIGLEARGEVYAYDKATPRAQGNRIGVYVLDSVGSSSNSGIIVADQTAGTTDIGIDIAGADTCALWVGSGADNTDAPNGIMFGASKDTNLYRSAANTLNTDDSVVIGGTLAVNGDTITCDSGTLSFDNENLTTTGTLSSGIITTTGRAKGLPHHLRVTIIDPLSAQTEDNEICIWGTTDAALTVTRIIVTLDASANEVAGDLKYADTFIGLANATVINVFDTASGVLDDSSITSGAVAAGKAIYIAFDSAPNTAIKQMNIDIVFDYD